MRDIRRCRKSKIPFSEIYDASEYFFDNKYFQFEGKYYCQQIDTPMGGCISPKFANIDGKIWNACGLTNYPFHYCFISDM